MFKLDFNQLDERMILEVSETQLKKDRTNVQEQERSKGKN